MQFCHVPHRAMYQLRCSSLNGSPILKLSLLYCGVESSQLPFLHIWKRRPWKPFQPRKQPCLYRASQSGLVCLHSYWSASNWIPLAWWEPFSSLAHVQLAYVLLNWEKTILPIRYYHTANWSYRRIGFSFAISCHLELCVECGRLYLVHGTTISFASSHVGQMIKHSAKFAECHSRRELVLEYQILYSTCFVCELRCD